MSTNTRAGHPQLIVRTLSASRSRGWLEYGPFRWPCALGRTGSKILKREGDGATPRGRFQLRNGYFRPRHSAAGASALTLKRLSPGLGWCDDPGDRNYNREVRLPYPGRSEHLWRGDNLYDLMVVVGYNDRPRRRGRGSAIFVHVAKPGLPPTDGCVALRKVHLKILLGRLKRASFLCVP